MSPIRSDAVPLIEENIATRARKENARARCAGRATASGDAIPGVVTR